MDSSIFKPITERMPDAALVASEATGEITIEVAVEALRDLSVLLRDELGFEMLMDLCAVDYLEYGKAEWKTEDASDTGFSRGVSPSAPAPDEASAGRRFAVVYHLLSVTENRRVRVRTFLPDNDALIVPTVSDIWAAADWYEREAFDLYGVLFDGHPDLRRLLSDYGFIGHPFRKDYPLIGKVEVRYDPTAKRVVYEPVSIEPRTLVPKIIRDDNRYSQALDGKPDA